jgi:histidinol-phosphate aminotransferase
VPRLSRFPERVPGGEPPEWPRYTDRDPGLLRLDNNTNPRPNPCIRKAGQLARNSALNRYGSAHGSQLRAALAKYYHLDERSLLIGNGSDEILDLAARAYLGPGKRATVLHPTYDLYATFALRERARVRQVAVGSDLKMPAGTEWARATDLLFLCSPQNPTGASLTPTGLRRVARAVPGLVVVDEAYWEYSPVDLWTTGFDLGNVLFVRTFSKAWGLAGLRVGYGIGPPEIVARVEKFQAPFTLDSLAEAIAVEGLKERAFLRSSVRLVQTERPILSRALRQRGFRVFPSAANFVYTFPPVEGTRLSDALREDGVLVRRSAPVPECSAPLRITVGLPAENRRLLATLDRVLPMVAKRSRVMKRIR